MYIITIDLFISAKNVLRLAKGRRQKYPTKGDAIQHIYTDSLEILQKGEKENDSRKRNTLNNDKEKYRENDP
jgi:hypothetical protein